MKFYIYVHILKYNIDDVYDGIGGWIDGWMDE